MANSRRLLGELSHDTLVSELLDLLAEIATRVQAELDRSSTEPCFAEQIARGLLQGGGTDEFDAMVGARYLALEWGIDPGGVAVILESQSAEN